MKLKEKSTSKEKTDKMINEFIFSLYEKSENTKKTYTHLLNSFIAETTKKTTIKDIRLEHIQQYISGLKEKYKPTSINLTINVIKSFYNFCAENGYVNIGKYIKRIPVLPPEQRVLTREEYDHICSKIKDKKKLDCFKFLCNTGLRVSEFVSLKPGNVANGFLRVVGKGRKNRSIPMNAVVREIYSRNPNFEMIKRKNRQWIFRLCKELATKAKIPLFHPHSCRHYFANELFYNGVDMFTVSRLLGHSSTSVTESVYVHWSEESLIGTTDVLAKKN
jgi:site-specific recombinase XerD